MPFENSRLSAFRASPFFHGVRDDHLSQLLRGSSEINLRKGDFAFLRGERPSGLFIVLTGMIKLAYQGKHGKEKVHDLLGPGHVFGEETLFHGDRYPYAAGTFGRCDLLHVTRHAVQAVLATSPEFSRNMLFQLSHRLLQRLEEIEDIRLRTPAQRLARYLHKQCATSRAASPRIALAVPKHVLASFLNMTPEALSRCLSDLTDSGVIARDKAAIRILDRARLKEHID